MLTNNKGPNNKKEPEEEKRDLELENIVGNLFIAEYQVDKLRTRYGSISKCNKASVNVFKHNNKWYKISIMVDEMTTTTTNVIDHR
jgi:hypothetical protein